MCDCENDQCRHEIPQQHSLHLLRILLDKGMHLDSPDHAGLTTLDLVSNCKSLVSDKLYSLFSTFLPLTLKCSSARVIARSETASWKQILPPILVDFVQLHIELEETSPVDDENYSSYSSDD